jgi:rSAM/selenodomain-associated transferase 2
MSLISAIIPTRNEAGALPLTLEHLQQLPNLHEIIVVDGGSSDNTCSLAAAAGSTVYSTPPGRGGQLRFGAEQASGDVVLLLHADTWVPVTAAAAIETALRDPSVVGGGFWKVFRDPTWLMRGSRPRCGVRFYFWGQFMGDQGMFVRRSVLTAIGGIPNVPLMEEFELCRLLRARGRLCLARATVSTSARRFHSQGVLKTYMRMWRITCLYYLGTPLDRLRDIYDRK